jgi:hypothetical protein
LLQVAGIVCSSQWFVADQQRTLAFAVGELSDVGCDELRDADAVGKSQRIEVLGHQRGEPLLRELVGLSGRETGIRGSQLARAACSAAVARLDADCRAAFIAAAADCTKAGSLNILSMAGGGTASQSAPPAGAASAPKTTSAHTLSHARCHRLCIILDTTDLADPSRANIAANVATSAAQYSYEANVVIEILRPLRFDLTVLVPHAPGVHLRAAALNPRIASVAWSRY